MTGATVSRPIYGIVDLKDVIRFRQMELQFRQKPQLEAPLWKLALQLREKILPAFKHWILNSNTKGQDPQIDRPLHEIYHSLERAKSLEEVVMWLDMALHAQHKRGIFVAEIAATPERDVWEKVLDTDRLRTPWESA